LFWILISVKEKYLWRAEGSIWWSVFYN
jgi:hypothetical protein